MTLSPSRSQSHIKTALMISIAIVAAGLIWKYYPQQTLPPIRVGLLHSLTGTMAESERPVMDAELLAIDEINAAGGILGRKIEPIMADGKSRGDIFARAAEQLIQQHVSALFGCWTSASRKMVKPVVEKNYNILFYPVQYEGLESSPNIVYLGAAPNQQIIPAAYWAMHHLGKRIYLAGSDYVFPRVAHALLHRYIHLMGGQVVGEHYIPLGSKHMASMRDDIKRVKPDVIFNTINGDSNQAFFHALRTSDVLKNIAVLSFSVSEPEAEAIGTDAIGSYAAWNYFQSLKNPANTAFIKAFRQKYGAHRPISDPMETAYNAIYLWAQAVTTAGTPKPDIVLQTIRHQSRISPEGIIAIDHSTAHAWRKLYIGKLNDAGQFDVVYTSARTLRPEPYPLLISRHEAHNLLDRLYRGWGNHWAAPSIDHTQQAGSEAR